MPFTFLHTADLHLDSPLRSLALKDPNLQNLVGTASRDVLEAIIDLCLEKEVDALMIAGDLYDGSQTSMKTASFLVQQLRRLETANIPVFIIKGNHDAQSSISKALQVPDNVTVFAGRASSSEIERGKEEKPVFIHGLSFSKPKQPESLLPKYPSPVEGAINIGVMHTSLAGAEGHDPYAPCTEKDLLAHGYDYWALGHIHKRMTGEKDRSHWVMPGIPQGRDIGEAGVKSVSLVKLHDDRSCQIEEVPVAKFQFERILVQLTREYNWDDIPQLFQTALEQAQANLQAPHLVARLTLEGETDLAWRIARDLDALLEIAKDIASQWPNIHIEKLSNHSQSPKKQAAETSLSAGPLKELEAILSQEVLSSAEFETKLETIWSPLKSKLPPDIRNLFGEDKEAAKNLQAELAKEGSDYVLAHLHASQSEEQA